MRNALGRRLKPCKLVSSPTSGFSGNEFFTSPSVSFTTFRPTECTAEKIKVSTQKSFPRRSMGTRIYGKLALRHEAQHFTYRLQAQQVMHGIAGFRKLYPTYPRFKGTIPFAGVKLLKFNEFLIQLTLTFHLFIKVFMRSQLK